MWNLDTRQVRTDRPSHIRRCTVAKKSGTKKAGAGQKAGAKQEARAPRRMPWTKDDGQRLREMRKRFGLSQGHVATEVGVTSSRISELETVDFPSGRHCSPGKELAEKIADFFARRAARLGEKVAADKAAAKEARRKIKADNAAGKAEAKGDAEAKKAEPAREEEARAD